MIKRIIQRALRPAGYYLRSTRHFGDNYWPDLVTLTRERNSGSPLVFDVGAHHGETLVAIARNFPGANVYCFEPDPDSFQILKLAGQSLDNVRLHPIALGAEAGNADFHCNSESMTNSLLPTSEESLKSEYGSLTKTRRTIQVPIKTLDAVCAEEGIDFIDILKTDCQGYDLKVLEGADRMLSSRRVATVSCEVIFDDEYVGQGKYYQLMGFLDEKGYSLVGLYNMARNRSHGCTFCDAIFKAPLT